MIVHVIWNYLPMMIFLGFKECADQWWKSFVQQHFAASGFPCPHLRNPSDHFLRTVNADFDRVKSKIKGSFKHRVRLFFLVF